MPPCMMIIHYVSCEWVNESYHYDNDDIKQEIILVKIFTRFSWHRKYILQNSRLSKYCKNNYASAARELISSCILTNIWTGLSVSQSPHLGSLHVSGLWLVKSDHVTRILASDWLLPGSVLLPRTQPLQPPLWSRVWGVVNKLCELGILTMIQSYKDETDIAALCHFASIAAPGTGWLGTGSRHFYCLYWVIRRHRDTKRQKI